MAYDFVAIRAALAQRLESDNLSQSELCRRLGLPRRNQALISKIVRGESVSRGTLHRLARAMGLEPPPRKLFRPVCTKEEWQEFQEWKKGKERG